MEEDNKTNQLINDTVRSKCLIILDFV